jgi:hypothetical protein
MSISTPPWLMIYLEPLIISNEVETRQSPGATWILDPLGQEIPNPLVIHLTQCKKPPNHWIQLTDRPQRRSHRIDLRTYAYPKSRISDSRDRPKRKKEPCKPDCMMQPICLEFSLGDLDALKRHRQIRYSSQDRHVIDKIDLILPVVSLQYQLKRPGSLVFADYQIDQQ